ncbi:uncharacterized protein LOC144905799 [Branchiostoma floridae x Branchiostoma belcheri]
MALTFPRPRLEARISMVCPGVDNSYDCPALDDVFLYHQNSWRGGDGAYGLDLQTTSYAVPGAGKYNLWALCAGVFQCMGGGTPVDQIGNYTCDCPKGTTGDRCETVVDGGSCYKFPLASASHFAAEKACHAEGGHLAVVKDAGTQRFLSNHIPTGNSDSHWIGTKVTSGQLVFSDQPSVFDQVAGMDWAEDSPGMPCALCVLLDNADGHKAKTTSCTEKHSFICQSEAAPCQHNVCLHGGNCTSCFGGTATVCACPSGFHGKFCENRAAIQRCSVASCPPGWTCDDQATHFLCIEPGTRTGSPYQCSSASCPNDMYCKEEGEASFSCRPR